MATRRKNTDPNPWRRRLAPADCLLLVIDLQEKFVPYLRRSGRVLRSTSLLLRTAEVLGMPVVVTSPVGGRATRPRGITVPPSSSRRRRP